MSGLLTEDEIVAEASKDSTYCQLSVDIGLWARDTQTKRLVEWLEAEMETAPLGLRLARFKKCMQVLKKEVEDG